MKNVRLLVLPLAAASLLAAAAAPTLTGSSSAQDKPTADKPISSAEAPKILDDAENLVARRIQGTWKIDMALSNKLDPAAKESADRTYKFTYNAGVMPGLQAAWPRLQKKPIFSAGICETQGKTHPYLLSSEHGNMLLTIYTGEGTAVVEQSVIFSVAIAIGAKPGHDLLILGPSGGKDPSLMFTRDSGAAPASAPKK